jgi:hypothetical protein
MSNAVLKGNASGTGTVTLETPNTNSDLTISMPAAAGTMMVSGNMPAFSAFQSSAQTLSSNTFTKLQFQTEEWDTASAFDNTTNYRFNPQVAGYYLVTGSMTLGASVSNNFVQIYKNGSVARFGSQNTVDRSQISAYIYLNGTTDYIELYGRVVTGQVLDASSTNTYFQASLVRAA